MCLLSLVPSLGIKMVEQLDMNTIKVVPIKVVPRRIISDVNNVKS